MTMKRARASRCSCLILLLVVMCTAAFAQHTADGLGGAFNNPAGTTITKTIMDRIARRNRERRLAAARRSSANSTVRTSSADPALPAAKLNEASVLFRPTGTQLKTRQIANLIHAGNPQA